MCYTPSTYALGDGRPNGGLTTPISLLPVIKLRCIVQTPLNSPDGEIKGKLRFALVESGDVRTAVVFLLS